MVDSSLSPVEGNETRSLFFYGTLVHPAILSRIIGSPGSNLTVQNAILPNYSTFHVKGADYPGLLDPQRKQQLIPDSSEDPIAVPGTLVSGLTSSELLLLDGFEGESYERQPCTVILDPQASSELNTSRPKDASLASILSGLTSKHVQELLEDGEGKQEKQCETYVWIDSLEKLEKETWDFGQFARSHAHRWVGKGLTEEVESGFGESEGSHAWEEYAAVDKLREASSTSKEIEQPFIPEPIASSSNLNIALPAASVPDPWATQDSIHSTSAPAVEPANPWAVATHAESIPNSNESKRKGSLERKDSLIEEDGEFGMEKFGNSAKKRWWSHAQGYTNLNNGSFGSCPRPVCEAFKALQDKAEEQPDFHLLKTEPALYEAAIERLSELLNAPSTEIALVNNATTATNAVLRDIHWEKNDAILVLSTVYGAVERTLQYLYETHPSNPTTVMVEINYPMKHDEVVKAVEEVVSKTKKEGKVKLRLGIVDAITSAPGVIVPWERLVKVLRDQGIMSFIDGAHAIGQIPVDLGSAQPDFFVSNCHKWLYAKRGCAVFYVPKRNQHINKSSLPTSHWYMNEPTEEKNNWKLQWSAFGTVEMGTLLSVSAALDFRGKLGGEVRIRNYNNSLARRGGEVAAKILQTEIMETEDEELTAAMVNVRLPLMNSKVNEENWYKVRVWMMETLTNEYKTVMPVFRHNEKMWARISAQVWLELSDFEYGARALKAICQRINSEEVTI